MRPLPHPTRKVNNIPHVFIDQGVLTFFVMPAKAFRPYVLLWGAPPRRLQSVYVLGVKPCSLGKRLDTSSSCSWPKVLMVRRYQSTYLGGKQSCAPGCFTPALSEGIMCLRLVFCVRRIGVGLLVCLDPVIGQRHPTPYIALWYLGNAFFTIFWQVREAYGTLFLQCENVVNGF